MPDAPPVPPASSGAGGGAVRHAVSVWADLTCPWCYLGRFRLNRAVAASEHPRSVTIRQYPHELDPDLPPRAGLTVREAALRRDADPARVEEELRRVGDALAAAGLPVDLDRAVAANTFDAHRVVELAWRTGGSALQSAVVERFTAGHFAQGLALDDPSVLARLGPEAGLEEWAIKALLAGRELADVVLDARVEAAALAICDLPVVTVDGGHRIDGPQPVDVLLALLNQSPGQPAAQPPATGT